MVKQVKHLGWPPWVGRSPHALREYAYSDGFCSANAPGEKPESRAWGRETAQLGVCYFDGALAFLNIGVFL